MAGLRGTLRNLSGAARLLAAFLCALALGVFAASAQDAKPLKGVALVIGNSDYEHLTKLPNPANDARAIEEMLNGLGFDTTVVSDRNARRLKRDLEGFVEDAEGADVAVLYYSGHGIEAGGENYLVPVSADLSALDAADEELVPVSAVVDELKASVPVTIMLLDACRSEAFPDGSAILLPGSDAPVPLEASGLGEMRGPAPVARLNVAPESLGMVIGFAAAPGQPALDGEPGGNSPYAAALLKHLGAGGYAFGDLMTLVTEEVYLKTGAKQIPWMNSSLRRVLSFGTPIESTGDDESLIRDGRRQLLLSIAAMPVDVRQQVEVAAAGAAVPMDTLFGLLEALGEEAPDDPQALDQLLKTQIDTLRKVMDERRALSSTDPEIMRLAELAQRAQDEGVLSASVRFWEGAKARYAALSASLDTTEELLKQRRLEGGELYARTASAYGLSGDFSAAAENFALAYDEVERWDDAAALAYKSSEGDALFALGEQRGDNSGLDRAIVAYGEALRLVEAGSPDWAVLQRSIGSSYGELASRDGRDESVAAAIEAYRAALGAIDPTTDPIGWAATQTRLGAALSVKGEREATNETLEAAVEAYESVLRVITPETAPGEWRVVHNNLGNSLRLLGERDGDIDRLEASVAAFRVALGMLDRAEQPYDWALTLNNLGGTLARLGLRNGDMAALNESVNLMRQSLQVVTAENSPMIWAQAQGNLGATLARLGEMEAGTGRLEEAVIAYEAALTQFTPDRALLDWATATTNLGNAYSYLGLRTGRAEHYRAATDKYRAIIERLSVEQAPLQWAQAQNNLGATLNSWGELTGDTALFEEAYAALQTSLAVRNRDRVPLDWAMTQSNIGNVMSNIGWRQAGVAGLLEAAAAYSNALTEQTRERGPRQWADLQMKLGNVLQELGLREEAGLDRYQASLDAYNSALEVFTLDADPLMWATVANSAGWTLVQAGYRAGDSATMKQGREAIQAAWDTVRAAGISEQDAYFSERIAVIDEALAAAPPPPAQ